MTNLGYIQTEEHKRKRVKSRMGYQHTQETKDKISKAHIGFHHSEKSKRKMSKSQMGRLPSYGMLGKHLSEESKRKMSEIHKGITKKENPNLAHSEESKRKISRDQKRLWQNIKYKEEQQRKMRLGCHVKPTKPERILRACLEKLFPKEYKYVGDCLFWINGRNPDFLNINGQKKVIELFGNYWHGKEKTGRTKKQEESHRIEHFSKYGFRTLVIWESELKNIKQLKKKLLKFHNDIS